MLGREYETQVCSIARALEVVGERWSLLIIRDVLLGVRRFDDLQASLGITRSVLTARLARLLDEGLLERRRYHEHPERFEYHPTAQARDLFPVLAHLMQWGDRYYPAPSGPPRIMRHRRCGGELDSHLCCQRCGAKVLSGEVETLPGPGAPSLSPAGDTR